MEKEKKTQQDFTSNTRLNVPHFESCWTSNLNLLKFNCVYYGAFQLVKALENISNENI